MSKTLVFLVMFCFSCSISFADTQSAKEEAEYQAYKRKEQAREEKEEKQARFLGRLEVEKQNSEKRNLIKNGCNYVRSQGADVLLSCLNRFYAAVSDQQHDLMDAGKITETEYQNKMKETEIKIQQIRDEDDRGRCHSVRECSQGR